MTAPRPATSPDARPVPPWYGEAKLGIWLRTHGEAIYTRTDRAVYAIVLSDRLPGSLVLQDLTLPASSRIRALTGNADLAWTQAGADVQINTDPSTAVQHAHVLAMTSTGWSP